LNKHLKGNLGRALEESGATKTS